MRFGAILNLPLGVWDLANSRMSSRERASERLKRIASVGRVLADRHHYRSKKDYYIRLSKVPDTGQPIRCISN